jgi:hypothetical protein
VSLTVLENLPLVSTTPAVPVVKFAAGVIDAGSAPSLANISTNFRKNQNARNVIFRGLGEDDSRKKPEAKNLLTLSLERDRVFI